MLLSQLDEFNTDFTVGQDNRGVQTESRTSIREEIVTSNIENNSAPVDGSQADVHTLERIITAKLRSGVDSVVATVDTGKHDEIFTAIEGLAIPGVELAMKSVNAFSPRDINNRVPGPDQRDLSGNINGLQMTEGRSIRQNSNTDLNQFDETHGIFTVEIVNLPVNERNSDRYTRTHHRNHFGLLIYYFKTFRWLCKTESNRKWSKSANLVGL